MAESGDLTRDILRTELRAARAEDRLALLRELDDRFKPITTHLAAIDGGQFSDGMRAGIVAVMAADHAVSMQKGETRWSIRSSKLALVSVALFAAGFIFNVTTAFAHI